MRAVEPWLNLCVKRHWKQHTRAHLAGHEQAAMKGDAFSENTQLACGNHPLHTLFKAKSSAGLGHFYG